jgi:hypothetical protein
VPQLAPVLGENEQSSADLHTPNVLHLPEVMSGE